MAADGGRQAPSVEEQLFGEAGERGRLFDFFQAVALLEALQRKAKIATAGVGEGGAPSAEALRFASDVRLAFPPTDIKSIARAAEGGDKPVMTVSFMGLAGALGPLPLRFAEQIMRRAHLGDTAGQAFLDIFNHRLISIVYRIRKRHRVGLGCASPEKDDASRYLFSLIGFGTGHLRNRLGAVPDRALLHYAGLFARDVRPLADLAAILADHFRVPVTGESFTGAFYPIEPEHRTVIGPSGRNRRLGQDAVLGSRVWDAAACFDLRVGPLGVRDYLRLLPGTPDHRVPDGDRLAPLCTLVRLYAGPALDFRVRLVLDPAAARRPVSPRVQTLGERPRLGYTAWVGRAFQRREVVLSGAALQRAAGAAR